MTRKTRLFQALWRNPANGSERGSSLAEVLVAIAILGIVGVTLLGGLGASNKIANKSADVMTANSILRSAADAVKNQMPFTSCNSNPGATNPYSPTIVASPILPSGVTVDSVAATSATGATAPTYTSCSAIGSSSQLAGSQTSQQVGLTYTDPGTGITQHATVLKYVSDCSNCQPINCPQCSQATAWHIELANSTVSGKGSTSVKLLAGDTDYEPLSAVGASNSGAQLSWNIVQAPTSGISVSVVPNFNNLTTSSLRITADSSIATTSTYTVQLAARDYATLTDSATITITITVYPMVSLTGISGSSDLDAMVGCGFLGSTNGATATSCGTTFGSNLVITGGAGDEAVLASNAASPYLVTSCGTQKGCLKFDTTSTSTGAKTITVDLSGSVITSAANLYAHKVLTQGVVRPQYSFGTSSSPIVATCSKKTFNQSTSQAPCSVTISAPVGSGSRLAPGSWVAGNAWTDKTASSGYASYSSSTDTATLTLQGYPANNGMCAGKSQNNSSGTFQVGTVKDPRLGANAIPVWISITC